MEQFTTACDWLCKHQCVQEWSQYYEKRFDGLLYGLTGPSGPRPHMFLRILWKRCGRTWEVTSCIPALPVITVNTDSLYCCTTKMKNIDNSRIELQFHKRHRYHSKQFWNYSYWNISAIINNITQVTSYAVFSITNTLSWHQVWCNFRISSLIIIQA